MSPPISLHFDLLNHRNPSQPVLLTIAGIRWQLTPRVVRDASRASMVCEVSCDSSLRQSRDWSCEAAIEFRLCARTSPALDYTHMVSHTFSSASPMTSWSCSTTGLVRKDFDDDDRYRMTVAIFVTRVENIRPSVSIDFSSPNPLSDTVVVVGTRRFHVNKAFVSVYSSVLAEHLSYYDGHDVPLTDVAEEDFGHMLDAIYPSRVAITVNSVGGLLKMGERFDISCLIEEAESFLQECFENGSLDKCQILEWAVQFKLHILQTKILSTIEGHSDVDKLATEQSYSKLSSLTKALMFERLREVVQKPRRLASFMHFLPKTFRRDVNNNNNNTEAPPLSVAASKQETMAKKESSEKPKKEKKTKAAVEEKRKKTNSPPQMTQKSSVEV